MRNRGFTLIELLVVIALLAVLLVLAAPNIFGVKDKAIEGLNAQQEKSIKDASLLVAVDLDDYMSRIYNCKSDSWLTEGEQCTKDGEHKWYQVRITVQDLVDNGYFDDVHENCKGNIVINKHDDGSYKVTLTDVKCNSK